MERTKDFNKVYSSWFLPTWGIILSFTAALILQTLPTLVYADDFELKKLASLSIEELFLLDVSTASRKEESLFDTPAAVYVITGEDIRRSGVRSIPEALRLAPGVHVARIDANKWAISKGVHRSFQR